MDWAFTLVSVLGHQVIPNCQLCAKRTYLLFALDTSKSACLLWRVTEEEERLSLAAERIAALAQKVQLVWICDSDTTQTLWEKIHCKIRKYWKLQPSTTSIDEEEKDDVIDFLLQFSSASQLLLSERCSLSEESAELSRHQHQVQGRYYDIVKMCDIKSNFRLRKRSRHQACKVIHWLRHCDFEVRGEIVKIYTR